MKFNIFSRTRNTSANLRYKFSVLHAQNFQLPLEPLSNSDISLVVIIDLLLLTNITKKLNGVYILTATVMVQN